MAIQSLRQVVAAYRKGISVLCLIVALQLLSYPLLAQQFVADSSVAKEEVLRKIPQKFIDKARRELVIAYQHTSHGTHVARGVFGLQDYKTGDTLLFGVSSSPSADSLEFRDYALEDYAPPGVTAIDLSVDETAFIQTSRNYLDAPENASVNVIMWSWCNIDGHDAAGNYLPGMDLLISEYGPDGSKIGTGLGMRELQVTFIFMTGHANVNANTGSPTRPKEQADTITSYCDTIQQFCLDYYSIDTHDMDDNYWEDAGDDGNSASYGGNFYHDWQNSHILGVDYFENKRTPGGSVDFGEHTTQHITANRKGYAMWWILARIAGWDGDTAYIPVTSIEISNSGDVSEIGTGDTLRFSALVLPDTATYKEVGWSVISESGTTTIDADGLLSAGIPDSVTVVATAQDTSGVSASFSLRILPPPVLVNSLEIISAGGVTELRSGADLQFSVVVLPDTATNKEVDWNIVNGSGSASIDVGGLLSAGNPGSVTVVARAKDSSGVSANFPLSVLAPLVPVSGITIESAGDVTALESGATLQFSASVLPDIASNKELDWSVSNGTGTASISAEGLLTAGNPGTVTVVASAKDGSGVSDRFDLSIATPMIELTSIIISSEGDVSVIEEGEMLQFTATVSPSEADNPSVFWHVSSIGNSSGMGTITEDGMFIALVEGDVEVVAIAQDGSGVNDRFTITVMGSSSIEKSKSGSINLYPNPGKDLFYLNTGNLEAERIQVVDANGAVVLELAPESGNQIIELDLSGQQAGLYIIKAMAGDQFIVRQAILYR